MPAVTQSAKHAHAVGFTPVITLVLWAGSLLVGTLGLTLPYARPPAPTPPPPPVTFRQIPVELEQSPLPHAPIPILPITPLTAPPPAPPAAVTARSPALAIVQPVPGPVHMDASAQTASSFQAANAVQNVTIQPLVYGQGEGRQPLPPYPSAAKRGDGQEGIVTVQLNVDPDGRVTGVKILTACRWPLLNASALRTVRDCWHFSPGAPRSYHVAIRFTLEK